MWDSQIIEDGLFREHFVMVAQLGEQHAFAEGLDHHFAAALVEHHTRPGCDALFCHGLTQHGKRF